MNKVFRLVPMAMAIAAAFNAYADGNTNGVVVGKSGAYIVGATVCIDANNNARCDAGEISATTDASGAFTLAGQGAVVAKFGATVFRAPVQNNSAVDALTTELQALMDTNGGDYSAAETNLATRLGVTSSQLEGDPNLVADPAMTILLTENDQLLNRIAEAVKEAGAGGNLVKSLSNRLALDQITNVVVIFAENRSFDNIYGFYPGANGINNALKRYVPQKDRNGSVLSVLPPAWNGLTAAGQPVTVTQAQTTAVWPNAPFQVDSATPAWGGNTVDQTIITRDLYHRFFENQMQINGGANDKFVADADSGGLVMGYYDGSRMALWNVARRYVLADNLYQGAFGGSFLNHQYLICACAPTVPAARVNDAANGNTGNMTLNTLTASLNGVPQLSANASQQASALNGPTSYKTGNIAPLDYFGTGDGYRAVNTMQPAYQPSGNKPVDNSGNDALYANPAAATSLPPQVQTTIGDLLTAKNLDWAWYAGGWSAAVANPYPWNGSAFGASSTIYYTNSFGTSDSTHIDLQAHHHPFNYYSRFDPVAGAAERAAHLKDYTDLVAAATAGTLPSVAFYKPVGFNNEHSGYTNIAQGDAHIANLIAQLQASPQWGHMIIVVTFDENGGFWDHAAPPKGDLIGPGSRIPALIISPFVKSGLVDHTQYDHASILRFLTHRYSLPVLSGLQLRDDALVGNGGKVMGDFTNALSF